MPPDHPDRCLKCSRQLPCWYHPIPNPNAPPPPIKKMPKFVSRPDTYHASQILKPHPPLQTPHPLTNNPTHHLDHRHLLHLHLPSPPPAPPPRQTPKTLKKTNSSTPKHSAYHGPTTTDSVGSSVCFGAKCPGPSRELSRRRLTNWRIRPSRG